jgi:hypothetical protein
MGNKRKRDKVHQPPWISVYRHTWNSPAWKHLSVGARATYVELAANYNTKRKNAVYIAARKGAKQLGVHKDYITQWLRELEHYGFIIKVCGPHLGLDGEARATRYRLTDRWYGDKPPTYDFEKWDGVLFEVQKRIDRRGISRLHAHRKNRIPSPTPRTPRPDTTDRKANGRGGQNGVERPDTTDRRDDAEPLMNWSILSLTL